MNSFDNDDYKSTRPHPIGRPPKLTLDMIEKICDLIIQGKSIAHAGILAGISESTLFRWLAIGRRDGADSIYAELVSRVNEATECSELELRQNIRIAAMQPKNWRASAWMLERRFPENYQKRRESSISMLTAKSNEGPESHLSAV